MGNKAIVYGDRTVIESLSPEEEAQRVIDEQDAAAVKVIKDAEKARLHELKASNFVSEIEDTIKGMTWADIQTWEENNFSSLPVPIRKFMRYLLVKAVLEVKQ